VGSRLALAAHPDLAVTQVSRVGTELTLLGFILDPAHPERSDAETLGALALQPTLDGLLLSTDSLTGRWALVVVTAAVTALVGDAAGLRQVHYAVSRGGVWSASQAGLLAQTLTLPTDPEAAEFASSLYFRSDAEPWWPGDSSLVAGVKRLLPNHWLDLASGTTHRFWPRAPVEAGQTSDPERASAAILRGAMVAAARRGPLALGLTAGLDSRTLLAASRDIAPHMLFCTTEIPSAVGNRRDRVVAGATLRHLGLPHAILRAPSRPDPSFRRVFRASADTAHDYCAVVVEAFANSMPAGCLFVSGNCSEIGRRYYRSLHERVRETPEGFAALGNMKRSPFAVAAFARWLESAGRAVRAQGYDVLDLLYWENRVGSWQASTQGERDVVGETYTPFACRRLIEIMLAADIAERSAPEYRFHRAVISGLWPEALDQPINPADAGTRVHDTARAVLMPPLRRLGVDHAVKTAYLRLRRWRTPRTHVS
jgi:hypothetical protein